MAKLKIEIDTDDYKSENELYESIIRGLKEAIEMNNAANEKKSKRWKPDDDDAYWYICSNGDIDNDTWVDGEIDNERFTIRNVFKTLEEAEFEIERRKVIAELENFVEENNDEIDWDNLNDRKYYFYYDNSNSTLKVDFNYQIQHLNIYFSSHEFCEQAIETVGEDRIKKYLFNVED